MTHTKAIWDLIYCAWAAGAVTSLVVQLFHIDRRDP